MPPNQTRDLPITSTPGTFDAWRSILDSFDDVVGRTKGTTLVELERWWLGIPTSKEGFGRDDLIQLIRWKGTRGKFRPALVRYAKDMNDLSLRDAVSEALRILKQDSSQYIDADVAKEALEALVKLRGIGPATASAILAAYDGRIPFMGDELLEALHDGNRQYTMGSYLRLFNQLQEMQKSIEKASGNGLWMSLREMERVVFVDTLRRREKVEHHAGGIKRRGAGSVKDLATGQGEKDQSLDRRNGKRKKPAR